MKKVEVYVKYTCPFCIRVLELYADKGVEPIVYDVAENPALRQEMETRITGARTVPQNVIDDTPVGGCDDVMALDKVGELDTLLGI